ncbi:hypothetical protein X975_16718, partial [Stegodyphus mimosarum]
MTSSLDKLLLIVVVCALVNLAKPDEEEATTTTLTNTADPSGKTTDISERTSDPLTSAKVNDPTTTTQTSSSLKRESTDYDEDTAALVFMEKIMETFVKDIFG